MLKLLALGLPLAAALLLLPVRARADGSWLDANPPAQWNQPGMPLPSAPAGNNMDPRCIQSTRPVETDADAAIADAGWYPIGEYQGGWGVLVVLGTSDFDGMCRPFGYQAFVFVDGSFAGTLSPELMNSRFDGALNSYSLVLNGDINAQFSRYTDTDPLCCPSRLSSASYHIDRSGSMPMVVPTSTSTRPSGAGG
jgi:hypothetical protein